MQGELLNHALCTSGIWPMASEPIGRVHRAGSETARDHPGYIDGAIESGRRAAAEVLVSRRSD